MSEPSGTGSLSKLEQLKAEYAEKARAEAPKYRPIDQACFDLLCPYAIGEVGMDRGGVLRTDRKTCKRKRCPKEKAMHKYCPNPDCRWRGETDAEECPECGYPLRQPK